MADILVSSSMLVKALGLPEEVIVYDCAREHGGFFRFKITGPMNVEDKSNDKS